MTAPTRRRPRAEVDTVDGDRIIRFDLAERGLHWANAVLVMVIMTTGAVLYFGPLSAVVGRRHLMKEIHVWAGVLLPVPVLAVLAGRWRHGFRRDVGRLTRWTADDALWLRTRGRSAQVQRGKFNGGQKLNALFVAGVLPVMLMTGSIMRWFGPFPDSWRTGATFVHDLGAYGVWIVVTAHIAKALQEPQQLRAMWSGWVPVSWARAHRPRWHAAVVDCAQPPESPEPGTERGVDRRGRR